VLGLLPLSDNSVALYLFICLFILSGRCGGGGEYPAMSKFLHLPLATGRSVLGVQFVTSFKVKLAHSSNQI
jgi:hypothetical protein